MITTSISQSMYSRCTLQINREGYLNIFVEVSNKIMGSRNNSSFQKDRSKTRRYHGKTVICRAVTVRNVRVSCTESTYEWAI